MSSPHQNKEELVSWVFAIILQIAVCENAIVRNIRPDVCKRHGGLQG